MAPKIIDLARAGSLLTSNMRIVSAMASSEPAGLFSSLHQWASDKTNMTVYCSNPNKDYPCFVDSGLAGKLRLITLFLSSPVRKLQGHGVVSYLPTHLSAWSQAIFMRGPVDVFWGSCTPPDDSGFVSLGPNSVYESEILRRAKLVILEVNKNLPFVFGAPLVPLRNVDYMIEGCDRDLYTLPAPTFDEVDARIADHVADLIPDGGTIQLGIGGIPNALGEALRHKRDLGVHTEMINDTIVDLVNCGVVTGRHKTLWPETVVGAFAMGTQKTYDFTNRNPGVLLVPGSVANDMVRLGRNHKMHSVNTCVEIDITGQVVSESVGHRELSGVGGAADTHVGAQRSSGGRGIVAVRSTSPKGTSKIVFELMPGAKVSISRNDCDTVVTEHGVAVLKGKTVSERVEAMVSIAHPDFRDQLMQKAIEYQYV